MDRPIKFIWDRDRLIPASAFFSKLCDEQFGEGEEVTMQRYEPRSGASHNHYFATIAEAWANLPDDMVERFPTPEHLRKYALIKAGYSDCRTLVCSSRAEALRVAAFIGGGEEYLLVTVKDATVYEFRAQSQAYRAMGKARFQDSKDKTLDVISQMIGTSTDDLQKGVHHA